MTTKICQPCLFQGQGGFIKHSGNVVHHSLPIEPCEPNPPNYTVDNQGNMIEHPRLIVNNRNSYGVEL